MNNNTELELWLQAEKHVEVFIEILQKRYGITEEEIPKLLDGIRWANKHKTNIEGISMKALYTITIMIVTGVGIVLWEGFKQLLGKH